MVRSGREGGACIKLILGLVAYAFRGRMSLCTARWLSHTSHRVGRGGLCATCCIRCSEWFGRWACGRQEVGRGRRKVWLPSSLSWFTKFGRDLSSPHCHSWVGTGGVALQPETCVRQDNRLLLLGTPYLGTEESTQAPRRGDYYHTTTTLDSAQGTLAGLGGLVP